MTQIWANLHRVLGPVLKKREKEKNKQGKILAHDPGLTLQVHGLVLRAGISARDTQPSTCPKTGLPSLGPRTWKKQKKEKASSNVPSSVPSQEHNH